MTSVDHRICTCGNDTPPASYTDAAAVAKQVHNPGCLHDLAAVAYLSDGYNDDD